MRIVRTFEPFLEQTIQGMNGRDFASKGMGAGRELASRSCPNWICSAQGLKRPREKFNLRFSPAEPALSLSKGTTERSPRSALRSGVIEKSFAKYFEMSGKGVSAVPSGLVTSLASTQDCVLG